MKTVGEILKKKRNERFLELDTVERTLKIRKKFLIALEENAWDRLPSLPYIKGFLKNYASYLGLNPDEMLAILRREFRYHENTKILPEQEDAKISQPFIRLSPGSLVAIALSALVLAFLTYLFFQFRAAFNPPSLSIAEPREGEVLNVEQVRVVGRTEVDVVVSINNQKIAVNDMGEFATTLTMPPGINSIAVEATNKHGKKTSVTRTIQIIFTEQ